MEYIFLGILGFGFFLGFDICSFLQRNKCKYVFGIIGLAFLLIPTTLIISQNTTVIFEESLSFFAYIVSLIFFALLIYSVFVEVGKNNYEFSAKPKLVTDGTYSLVRHPGVIWFLFTYLFASIAFESWILFYASISWTVVNILYTIIQEKLILYKVFQEYKDYIRSTPMFIPNITSIKRFITLDNWRK